MTLVTARAECNPPQAGVHNRSGLDGGPRSRQGIGRSRETPMRRAIEAISTGADEIHERLVRATRADATDGGRQLSSGLVLVLVFLDFLILAIDLLRGDA
jgi:hypothetical protein